MYRRYSFLISFLALLSGLTWWSGQISLSSPLAAAPALLDDVQRRDLLKSLDRAQQIFHDRTGRFARDWRELVELVQSSEEGDVAPVQSVQSVQSVQLDELTSPVDKKIPGRTPGSVIEPIEIEAISSK